MVQRLPHRGRRGSAMHADGVWRRGCNPQSDSDRIVTEKFSTEKQGITTDSVQLSSCHFGARRTNDQWCILRDALKPCSLTVNSHFGLDVLLYCNLVERWKRTTDNVFETFWNEYWDSRQSTTINKVKCSEKEKAVSMNSFQYGNKHQSLKQNFRLQSISTGIQILISSVRRSVPVRNDWVLISQSVLARSQELIIFSSEI